MHPRSTLPISAVKLWQTCLGALTWVSLLLQKRVSYSTSSCIDTIITIKGVSIPCGLVTALDVGFSNMALVRISITFFTMVKSSSPIWVLISAFIFGLEKITCNLILVGALITSGEILTAFGEVEFDTVGFLLCLTAAVLSGIRWTLMQFKLQKVDPPGLSGLSNVPGVHGQGDPGGASRDADAAADRSGRAGPVDPAGRRRR